MGDTRPELHEKPTTYRGSSSSDDTDDQRVEIHEDQGTAPMEPFRTTAVVRHKSSSRENSIPLEQESDIRTARIALQNMNGEANGSERPVPMLDNPQPSCRQKASGKTEEKARLFTGNRIIDVDYNSIPDYSPPLSTLPRGNPHILQVNWRGKPSVDLSNDPDRHLLHKAELELVTTLNLSCAKYLCTKRRIFQAFFKALQAGKEFKRSDCQKVCKIDANKVSKLCGVFEKVGWFDRKYFLEYLKESSNPLSHEKKGSETSSSGLTKPNIWDVSESEFSFTSEGDEESTDDDTADSSVSSDGRHDQTKGRRILNSYQDNLLWQQESGLSLTEGDGSQRRGLNDRLVQAHDARSRDKAADEGPMIDDRTSRRGVLLGETVYPETSEGLPKNDTEEVPMLETRSMTQKIRLALNSHTGGNSDGFSTIKPTSNQQESSLKKLHRRVAVPHSLDEANSADTMLVKMKEKGRL